MRGLLAHQLRAAQQQLLLQGNLLLHQLHPQQRHNSGLPVLPIPLNVASPQLHLQCLPMLSLRLRYHEVYPVRQWKHCA